MSEEKEEKKGILLHLPQNIFEIMKAFKISSGVSYTNQMYNSIIWWLVKQGLLDRNCIINKNKNETNKND